MPSILEPDEPVSVEFDGRHGRELKTFPAAWLAKKFAWRSIVRGSIPASSKLRHRQRRERRMGPIERTIRRALAARLKRETRYRVAKQTGVSYQAISSFVAGEADMRLSSIEALCGYLKLELKSKKGG
jgi:hypothetical protein